ncbi:MAG TPA: ribonuclease HII [Candidatus Limnocylindrales bacterium]|nr:ribonuclease HII [Candidatus Limnocylindrales bacterium]
MGIIVGIDEVGRGSWAGPVVAAAVILHTPIAGLNDSKLLSKKLRSALAGQIKTTAYYGIGWVSAAAVDGYGLTEAVRKAMEQALGQIRVPYDEIIIDGNYNYLRTSLKSRTLVKADTLIPAVSAASILAKVARDQYMSDQAKLFPGYGFESHVGYGTALHLAALRKLGICELHRCSYKPVQALML